MNVPPRIGVTGGIGSGKSTVMAMFAQLGAATIDTDAIARALTGAGGGAIAALCAAFGPAVLDAHGALDRGRMRQRAFGDPAVRRTLESVLHPLILEQVLVQAQAPAARAAPAILVDVPLLLEAAGMRAGLALDRVLVVDCPVHQQQARVLARGGLGTDEAGAIIAAQAPRAARLAIADDVLVNAGTRAALQARVERLWASYRGAPGGRAAQAL